MNDQRKSGRAAGLVVGLAMVATLAGPTSVAVGRPIGPGGQGGDGRATIATTVPTEDPVLLWRPCFIVQARWDEALDGPQPRCLVP
jgi:hypothetical protein